MLYLMITRRLVGVQGKETAHYLAKCVTQLPDFTQEASKSMQSPADPPAVFVYPLNSGTDAAGIGGVQRLIAMMRSDKMVALAMHEIVQQAFDAGKREGI